MIVQRARRAARARERQRGDLQVIAPAGVPGALRAMTADRRGEIPVLAEVERVGRRVVRLEPGAIRTLELDEAPRGPGQPGRRDRRRHVGPGRREASEDRSRSVEELEALFL